jgi:hypothetical protein
MKSSKQESDKAGFEYYLENVQKAREEAQREIHLNIMNALALKGGRMKLVDLAAEQLHPEAGNEEITEFWGTIEQMQAADLVETTPIEGDPSTQISTMDVWLTDFGKKILASGLGTQKSAS